MLLTESKVRKKEPRGDPPTTSAVPAPNGPERIAAKAYDIWLREGCPQGRHLENWRQAEEELARETTFMQSDPTSATDADAILTAA